MAVINNLIIVGPSGCGKSTLAKSIATQLDLDHYSLDDYYIEADPIYVLGADGEPYKTYERSYMYDGEALGEEVKASNALLESFTKDTPYAVIEGFIALQYQSIRNLPAVRIYLDLAFNECLARRKARPRHIESDKAWEMIGESEAKEFVIPQMYMDGVHVLDARLATTELVKMILPLIIPDGI